MQNAAVIKHPSAELLSADDKMLLLKAKSALDLSYAPYSHFLVGSALLTDQGHIVLGANQENASFSLCICGERVALYNAAIHFPEETIVSVAICVKGHKPLTNPAPPCGACLQVLREFEDRQSHPIRLLLQATSEEVYEVPSVSVLMPLGFDRSFL